MVKRGSKYKAFAAVFGKCALTLWLVVDKGLHANGDEGSGVVVVWVVHVGVGGNVGGYFRLA